MRATALWLAACFALLGCGDDNPVDPDNIIPAENPVDPEGVWTFSITVTDATQDCDGEEGQSSAHPITITITGGTAPILNVSASGFLGVPGNVLSGTFNEDANRLAISGSYAEDGGTTTPSHDLVAITDDRMVGTETWGWTDGLNTCPGSTSSVNATRVVP